MRTSLSSFGVGLLFALGLGLAGMTRPENVVSFLDILGAWNPSLIFVMAGALAVHMFLFRVIIKRKSPLFASKFRIPNRREIDRELLIGAMLFGIGWGLVGYCPAPALTALASISMAPFLFAASLLLGMILFIFFEKVRTRRTAP